MTALRTAAPAHAAPDLFDREPASIPELLSEHDWLTQVECWLKRRKLFGDRNERTGRPIAEWDALLAQREDPEAFLHEAALGYALDRRTPHDLIPVQAWMAGRDWPDELIKDVIAHLVVGRSLDGVDFDGTPEWEQRELRAEIPVAWNWDAPEWNDTFVTETDSSVATLEPPAEPELLTKPSYWLDGVLWWRIGGRHISDADLRSWCYQHMPYPWNHVDVVRKCHVDAWAQAHGVALDAAISATPDDAAVV